MMQKIKLLAISGVIGLSFACAGSSSSTADAKAGHEGEHAMGENAEHKCEACAKGKAGGTAWCEKCNKGFVEGNVEPCGTCFKHKAEGGEPCSEHSADSAAATEAVAPAAEPATDS